MDHNIKSIRDHIDEQTLKKYDAVDVNVYQTNTFHTKMLIKEIELQNYLFNHDVYELPPQKRLEIVDNLERNDRYLHWDECFRFVVVLAVETIKVITGKKIWLRRG